MKAGQKVRMRKVGEAKDAAFPTPMQSEYVPGADNGPVSLPLDYEIVGDLCTDIEVGKRIVVLRTHRNGVVVPGSLVSSAVTDIQPSAKKDGKMLVTTKNSMYIVECL